MLAVALGAAVLLSACASIPESTPVEIVEDSIGGPEPSVAAPPPGLGPLAVVRGFVEAGVAHADEHHAARLYLTTEAAQRWDAEASVVVLEHDFSTAPSDSGASDPDRRSVTLRARQIGLLDPAGVFRLDRRDLVLRLTVLRDGGEWRVADPPRGLMLRISDFRSTYRGIDLSFVDATAHSLIRDRRWVLNRPESALPGRVVSLLLGEPSADLAGSVVNELSGARLLTNVAHAPDSVLTVDLTDVQELNDVQRRLAAAQVVHSLNEVVAGPVRILVDNGDLTPGRQVWRPEDLPFLPRFDIEAGLPGLVVTGGLVLQIGSNRPLEEVTVPNVVSAAQTADTTNPKLALVATEAGVPRLWVGPANALQPVDLPARTMSRPSWRQGRDEVWLVVDESKLVSVTVVDGEPRVQYVDASALVRHGDITSLRLSRDGVRVAAVVNHAVVLGSIAGTGSGLTVRNTRVLPDQTQALDVDFRSDVLVVGTANSDKPVYETSFDGLSGALYGASNLTAPVTSVAAVAGRPVLVSDQLGVWSSVTAGSVWQQVTGPGPNSMLVYPG